MFSKHYQSVRKHSVTKIYHVKVLTKVCGEGTAFQMLCSSLPTIFGSWGYTQSVCCLLGVEHARSALEGADCHDCELLSLRVHHSRLAVFDESGQARGPAVAEAQRRLLSWGSQVDLAEGSETGSSFSWSSPARTTAPSQGSEACAAVSYPQRESSVLHLSSSEEVDVMSVDTEETVDSPPQSLMYAHGGCDSL